MMTSKTYLLVIFALVVVAFVPSNKADSSSDKYWKTKVGNIPMPKSLKNSLQPGSSDGLVRLDPSYKPPFVDFETQWILFNWQAKYQINQFQIPQDGRVICFFEDTLFTIGTKMNILFKISDNGAKFLPSHIAKSMPTTPDKLLVILNILSVNPKSSLAQYIETSLDICGKKAMKGEKIYCATSMEGMVDFVSSLSSFGKNKLMALSTEQDDGKLMEYTIRKVQKLGNDDKHNTVCHKLSNPYVVYFCHSIKNTDLYNVYLVGTNGKQTKAIAACHKDTSAWSPNHYAFQYLKTKPGGKPICHFVNSDGIVWFRN